MKKSVSNKSAWYRIENAASPVAEIHIYNDIGLFGITAEQFVAEIEEISAPLIHLRVNSYGGEVFDGFAMFNALKRHDARVVAFVDGIAASAATYPVMAADEIRIARNGFLMIHNPLGLALGEADDMRKEAECLDKLRDVIAELYADRSGQDVQTIVGWMDAETWFTAQESIDSGFADAMEDENESVPSDPKNKAGRYWNNPTVPRVRPVDRIKALGLEMLLPDTATPAKTGKGSTMKKRNEAEVIAVFPDDVDVRAGVTYGPNGDDYTGSMQVNPPSQNRAKRSGGRNRNEVEITAVFPDSGDVRAGVTYGPAGDDYTGTLEGVSPEVAPPAAPPQTDARASNHARNATASELKNEFADDRDFLFERMDVAAPLVDHQLAYIDRLRAKNRAATEVNADLRERLSNFDPGTAGRKPVNTGAINDSESIKPITLERRKELLAMAGARS